MHNVPWWGLVSSVAAPVLLVGGWTVAAGLQPGSFNAVSRTISSLAAEGAADRWVMTLVLAAVGACDIITGLALRPAAPAGRLILIAGGAVGMLVAASPEPVRGSSLLHVFLATTGFVALTAWPAASRRPGPDVPFALRPVVSAVATGALFGLCVWFVTELIASGAQIGLAERVLTGAQAVWPLAAVVSAHGRDSPARRPRAGDGLRSP